MEHRRLWETTWYLLTSTLKPRQYFWMLGEHQGYKQVNKHAYWKTPLLEFAFSQATFWLLQTFPVYLKDCFRYSFQYQNIFRRKHYFLTPKNQHLFQSDLKFLVHFTSSVNFKFENACLSSSASALRLTYLHLFQPLKTQTWTVLN